MPMKQFPSLDELILNAPQGTLLAPICAKEVFVLRTIGTRWQHLLKPVTDAHRELMAHEHGFGAVDFKLYLTRKAVVGSVIQTVGQSIDVPQEIFEWPLSK